MSLSKQLLLLISLMFFLILTVNLVAGISNIRTYIEIESEIHAQDTATSLGLSLRPYMGPRDDTMLETMVVAIFDRGYYREIRLEDMDGKEIVSRQNSIQLQGVPEWFIQLLPMKPAAAQTELGSGWTVEGKLIVTVNPGIGYLKLWQQTRAALLYSGLAFLIAIIALLLSLRLVLKPLARIEQLALNIADGRFETISPLPWTAEIRNVARSMNMMSRKTESAIQNLKARLEEAGQRIKFDELTGLETQGAFEVEMKRLFIERQPAHLIVTRIEALGSFAREHGNQSADALVKDFAHALRASADEQLKERARCFRLVGAKFIVSLRGDADEARSLCDGFIQRLGALAGKYHLSEVGHLGVAPVDLFGTSQANLDLANSAYEKARLIGPNSVAFETGVGEARDMEQWHRLLADVIEQCSFQLRLANQAHGLHPDLEGRLVLEEALSEAFDATGQPIPIGTFVSLAENFGLEMAFDKAVVDKILQQMEQESFDHPVAINLSLGSIGNLSFLNWLAERVRQHKRLKSRLVFGLSAYAATKDLEVFKSFAAFIHSIGCQVMLKRFEADLIPLDSLKQYKLDYIRLARSYTDGIALSDQKRHMVQTMAEFGQLLDTKVLAEGVSEERDYQVICQTGLFAASR